MQQCNQALFGCHLGRARAQMHPTSSHEGPNKLQFLSSGLPMSRQRKLSRSLYDYTGTGEHNEVTFTAGEQIEVLQVNPTKI
jgi:hypothetical protein